MTIFTRISLHLDRYMLQMPSPGLKNLQTGHLDKIYGIIEKSLLSQS